MAERSRGAADAEEQQSGKTSAKKASAKKASGKKSSADSTTSRGKPPSQAASKEAASSGSAQTRSQRLGEKLTAAQDEHQANAHPTSSAAATKAAKSSGRRPPRRARLRLTRLDPWSVMKTSFLLSIAIGVVTVVSVMIVWSVLGAAGVWDSINATVADVVGTEETSNFDVENYIGLPRVLGFTMLVAAIDVVLLTAIATLLAFLYNMAAALLGGVEVTLAEDQR